MRCHDRQQKAAEGHKYHLYYRRNDLLEEAFQIGQREGRKHGGNDLSLIADHIDLDETKVPLVDGAVCQCLRHAVSVGELAGDKSKAEDDAEHLCSAHLLHDGPADTDRNAYMEDGFTKQPQEMVDACPELALAYQCRSVEDLHAVDDVAEAKDQASDDDGGNQRSEDFRDRSHQPLQDVLVLL